MSYYVQKINYVEITYYPTDIKQTVQHINFKLIRYGNLQANRNYNELNITNKT